MRARILFVLWTMTMLTTSIAIDDLLVVPVSTCGQSPVTTPWQLQEAVFGDGPNSARTLMAQCTRDRVRLKGQALPTLLDVPCLAQSQTCDFTSWAASIDRYLDANGYGAYRHRIYVVPGFCPFAGMGEVGCAKGNGTVCRAWINSLYAQGAAPYLHEIGHNLGLGHAGTPGDEYGDQTDAMGACCDVRCYNAVHTHQLGVDRPVQDIPCSNGGEVTTFELRSGEYVIAKDCPGGKWRYLQSTARPGAPQTGLAAYETDPWTPVMTTYPPTTLIGAWDAVAPRTLGAWTVRAVADNDGRLAVSIQS